MPSFDQVVTSFTLAGLAVAAVIAYLKINKIWARKHIKDVAESVSVAAALLSLFTTLPFIVKFLILDHDYVAAGRFAISLAVFLVFFLIGIGFFMRDREGFGVWRMVVNALRTERDEMAFLLHAFSKPAEAKEIMRILQLVSVVDNKLDEREMAVIESIARPWGIHRSELTVGARQQENAQVTEVRDAFLDYLAKQPPKDQVQRVFDLVQFMIHADHSVSREEEIILDELSHVVKSYIDDGYRAPMLYEVLVVPQRPEHVDQIKGVLPHSVLQERAGGEAFVAGSYFSKIFADEVCHRYRSLHYFSTVESHTA